MAKKFSHLQMDIFCDFDFCHNRKNGFWSNVSLLEFAWRAYFRCARAPRLCRASAVRVPRVRAVCPFLSLPLSSSAGKPCLIHSY